MGTVAAAFVLLLLCSAWFLTRRFRKPTDGPASNSEVCSHLLWSQGGVVGGLEDGGSAPLVVDALHGGQQGPAHLLTDQRPWNGSRGCDEVTSVTCPGPSSDCCLAPNVMFRMRSLVASRPELLSHDLQYRSRKHVATIRPPCTQSACDKDCDVQANAADTPEQEDVCYANVSFHQPQHIGASQSSHQDDVEYTVVMFKSVAPPAQSVLPSSVRHTLLFLPAANKVHLRLHRSTGDQAESPLYPTITHNPSVRGPRPPVYSL